MGDAPGCLGACVCSMSSQVCTGACVYTVCTSTCSDYYLLLHAAIPWPTTYMTFVLPSTTITTFAQRQPKNAQYSNPKPITCPSYSLPFFRPLPTAQLLLVVLRCNDTVLLNLALVHIAQCRHQLQCRCRGRGRESLDDVVLICNLTYTPSSAAELNVSLAHQVPKQTKAGIPTHPLPFE